MKGIGSIIGVVAHDLGILTTPQLHWMVHVRNKGLNGSERDYFHELSSSFRWFYFIYLDEKLVYLVVSFVKGLLCLIGACLIQTQIIVNGN